MATQNLDLIITLKDNASKALSKFESNIKNNAEQIKRVGIQMAAMGAVGAITINKLIKNSSDLNESINAINVVFGDGADRINEFGKTSARSIGIARNEFNSLASQTGALLLDTGKPLEEIADITEMLSIRAADMASVMNTSVADAFSAINQAVRGETEAIRRYTGDVTDNMLQQYLLSQGINTSVTSLNEQEKRLLRVSLIMTQTEKFAGDFANTSEALANKQRILSSEIQNISATLGDKLLPVALSVMKVVEKIVVKVAAWIEENPKLAEVLIKVAAAGTALMLVIAPFLIVLPGLIALFAVLTPTILIVVAAIAALITIGVAVMANWDLVKAKAMSVWGAITSFITSKFGAVIEFVKAQLNLMLALFDAIRDPSVSSFSALWDALKSVAFSAFDLIKSGITSMINFAIDKINRFIEAANSVADKVPGSGMVGRIPIIPRLAKGGIVDKPTIAMIGEDGAEAVIPLNRKNNPKGIGLGGITVIVQGSVTSERALIDVIKQALVDDISLSTAVT